MSTNKDQVIEQIAKECFHVETLETRNRDSLDFYDVAVWTIKEALSKAYDAGLEVSQVVSKDPLDSPETRNSDQQLSQS